MLLYQKLFMYRFAPVAQSEMHMSARATEFRG